MSQEEVFKILKELGGEATTGEIRERAKEKFPKLTLYIYVNNRLMKLKKNGFVISFKNKEGKTSWKIIKEYPASA